MPGLKPVSAGKFELILQRLYFGIAVLCRSVNISSLSFKILNHATQQKPSYPGRHKTNEQTVCTQVLKKELTEPLLA
jgi:hypothetical protein